MTTPRGDFDNDNLRTYLGRVAPTGSRTATRNVSTATATPTEGKHTSKTNAGKIAGGVLGGLAALIILLLLLLFCLRRRKRALASSAHPPSDYGKRQNPNSMPDLPLDNQRAIFTAKQPSLHTPRGSPPPSWQPVAVNYSPQYQQRFVEDLPQQHYPPPPMPIPYYPPPALPQQYEHASPTYELPNIRSPPNASDSGYGGTNRSFQSRITLSAHERINEE